MGIRLTCDVRTLRERKAYGSFDTYAQMAWGLAVPNWPSSASACRNLNKNSRFLPTIPDYNRPHGKGSVATAHLIVSIGEEQRECCIEPGTPCRIGRSPHNTIALPNESVSRAHAMVQFTDSGSCYLYDLDSRNGTVVNGRRISVPTMLRHGDRITIGPYTLGFVQEQPAEVPPAEPPSAAPDTLVSQQQQVTTVVVNIRDYADLERRLGASRLAEIVAALHLQARPILEEMGAWTQKYVGPAILAIWVHRSIKPPLHVVLSAFESVSRIARAAVGLQGQFGLDVAIRISAAIETGKTSLDNLNSRGSADLAALDDAVNRAFRIDSSATDPDREVAFGAATGEILLEGVALAEIAQQRSVALDVTAEPASLWVMSLDSLSRMLVALPQRTVRIALP